MQNIVIILVAIQLNGNMLVLLYIEPRQHYNGHLSVDEYGKLSWCVTSYPGQLSLANLCE